MGQRYTAAIVGCGGIGHAHVEGYNLVDEIELVAVADPLVPARQQYMEEYGIPAGFATAEEMLAQAAPDIVSVCTWHLLHPDHVVAAAEAGVKGVICEKPMSVGLGEADRMVAACDASGTRLVISHQRRFTSGWEKGRQLMRQQVVGEPVMVECGFTEGLLNCGTHGIDGVRFVLDEPEAQWVMGAVARPTNRFERDTPIEDSCMALVQMAAGFQLFLQSDLKKGGAGAGGFLIRGTEGLLDVREGGVKLFNGPSQGWQEVPLDGDRTAAAGGEAIAAQVRELLQWLEGGPEHRGAARLARATVEIMMALYESARQHRVIQLPLQEKDYPLAAMIAEGQLPPGGDPYDIRAFLKRDEIDEAAYARMRAEGKHHYSIMSELGRPAG